jgi:hypothetical protein
MTLRSAAWAFACVLVTWANPAGAQSLYGQGDWVLYRARTTAGGSSGFTRLFTQSYMVGYESVLLDRRLGTYLGELTFLKSSLRNNSLDGSSKNLGYNLGASLFPNRPFPF